MARIEKSKKRKAKGISKEVRALLKKIGKGKGERPFKTDLDLTRVPVHFTGHVTGGKKGDNVSLSILVYDTSKRYTRPLGALRITYVGWQHLRNMADLLLESHIKVLHRRSKPKKRKRQK